MVGNLRNRVALGGRPPRYVLILCAAYGETFLRAGATDCVATVYERLQFDKMNRSGPRGV